MGKVIATYKNHFKNSKSHDCENFAIFCIDFRFWEYIPSLLDQAGYTYTDARGTVGASKLIIENGTGCKSIFAAIRKAVKIHNTKRIILINHIDCGAYNGSKEHTNTKAEEKFHEERLAEARAIMQEEFPNLEIVTLYLDWNSLKEVKPKRR